VLYYKYEVRKVYKKQEEVMKEINIEINGKEVKGFWNGKTYSVQEKELIGQGYIRIYIDNKEYIIKQQKLAQYIEKEKTEEDKTNDLFSNLTINVLELEKRIKELSKNKEIDKTKYDRKIKDLEDILKLIRANYLE
jgi:hypothetical protein